MIDIKTPSGPFKLDGLPDECPFCHRAITPIPLFGFQNKTRLYVFMNCPNEKCKMAFVGLYDSVGTFYRFSHISFGNLKTKSFAGTISNISQSFVLIYNQSYSAEQQKLFEICGVGYRKALEFLIKDYLIKENPDKKEDIEKTSLGKCIENYITDEKIKSVSKRAAWLGNDETHYIRKWEGKNLEDLKKLIELSVHWIEMEALTKSFEEEMPES